MLDESKIEQIKIHYKKATTKHPVFCTRLVKVADPKEKESFLKICREIRKMDPSAQAILGEEIAEIYEAYAKGEKEHAIDECFDAIAVLIRMVEHIEAENEPG